MTSLLRTTRSTGLHGIEHVPRPGVVERDDLHAVVAAAFTAADVTAPSGQVDGPDLFGQGNSELRFHRRQLLGCSRCGMRVLLGDQPAQRGRVGAGRWTDRRGQVGLTAIEAGQSPLFQHEHAGPYAGLRVTGVLDTCG